LDSQKKESPEYCLYSDQKYSENSDEMHEGGSRESLSSDEPMDGGSKNMSNRRSEFEGSKSFKITTLHAQGSSNSKTLPLRRKVLPGGVNDLNPTRTRE